MQLDMKLETTQGKVARFTVQPSAEPGAILGHANLQLPEAELNKLEAGKVYTFSIEEAEAESPVVDDTE